MARQAAGQSDFIENSLLPLVTTGVLEGFLKGDRCRYDDGSVRNLLQSTVAAVARDITLVT